VRKFVQHDVGVQADRPQRLLDLLVPFDLADLWKELDLEDLEDAIGL
jgi:hypothetical protein